MRALAQAFVVALLLLAFVLWQGEPDLVDALNDYVRGHHVEREQ